MPENVSISFPHLGIALENLKNSFSFFGIDIAFYGVIIGCGMLVAMCLAFQDAKQSGQKVDDYVDLALYGIIFAIVGARIYYVIFQWDYYCRNLGEIFNLRKGGLAIYGGIIAGVLVCIVIATRRHLSVWRMLDTGAIGLVTGQMIGRWGNFFNREAYGGDTDSLFAMRININDPNVSVQVQPGVTVFEDAYIQVQPTFLYESFWCLCILLMLELFKKKKAFEGEVFLWYITAYGFGRFFIEGLRTDQLQIGSSHIAVSQVLSGVVFLCGIILIVVNRIRLKQGKTTLIVGTKASKVRLAMDFARKAHKGQTWRKQNGKDISYFEGHLMGVYELVRDYGGEEEMLLTALLHDVVEDTAVLPEEIQTMFGEKVEENVRWLTKGKHTKYEDYIDELQAHGSDVAIIVKLADRLYNTDNLMNLGTEIWHEKKIRQAKYILNAFQDRKFEAKYQTMAQTFLQMIEEKVQKLQVNQGHT